MTISKDRVKPSPLPDSWKLSEIFATGVILGTYLAIMTVIFFWIVMETNFFPVNIFLLFLKSGTFVLFSFFNAMNDMNHDNQTCWYRTILVCTASALI